MIRDGEIYCNSCDAQMTNVPTPIQHNPGCMWEPYFALARGRRSVFTVLRDWWAALSTEGEK